MPAQRLTKKKACLQRNKMPHTIHTQVGSLIKRRIGVIKLGTFIVTQPSPKGGHNNNLILAFASDAMCDSVKPMQKNLKFQLQIETTNRTTNGYAIAIARSFIDDDDSQQNNGGNTLSCCCHRSTSAECMPEYIGDVCLCCATCI